MLDHAGGAQRHQTLLINAEIGEKLSGVIGAKDLLVLRLALSIRSEGAIEKGVLVARAEGSIESTRCHFLIIFINITNVNSVIVIHFRHQARKDKD